MPMEGEAFVECSVATSAGVEVADVAWASADFLRRHGDADPYPQAPEIVVEVLSEPNSRAEMEEKQGLYFARGGLEFWLCDQDGAMLFFNANGQMERSALIANFPGRVELPFGRECPLPPDKGAQGQIKKIPSPLPP